MTATQTAVLQEKLALGTSQELPALTRRQVPLTILPGKAQAVIGMRRAGKTCFLFQQIQERVDQGVPRERLVCHELIQVCADASAPETAERALRALADAAAVFPKATCTLITLHQTGFPKLAQPAKTRVVTAWQWLLE